MRPWRMAWSGGARGRWARCGQSGEEGLCPPGEIAGGDPAVEGAHAPPPFVDLHADRDFETATDRFHVVRVDDHRFAELLGGTGELREDEDAVLRCAAATGHVLLGDQV